MDQSANYDFLLVIHSNHENNHEFILYRFQDKQLKLHIFHTPCVLNTPAKELIIGIF